MSEQTNQINQDIVAGSTTSSCDHKNSKSIFRDKRFWIGFGAGAFSVGIAAGFTSYSVTKKRERRRSAYEIREAKEKMQKYIDENSIEVEIGQNCAPEDIHKAVSEAIEARFSPSVDQESADNPEAEKKASEGQTEGVPEAKGDDIYAEKKTETIDIKNKSRTEDAAELWKYTGRKYDVQLKDGGVLSYPIEIFCDTNGLMDVGRIRSNLRIYERNQKNLARVWEALGWGEYIPDPDDGFPTAEEINNWDVSIGDIEDMEKTMGDEPEEKTIERERYMDKVERYKNAPSTGQPNIVTKRHFDEDNFLDHIYVNYYDVDNVFTDSTDLDSEIDATRLFGVANGRELFDWKAAHINDYEDDDKDPDIVYVESFADNSIAEITRYHVSYESVKNGGAYFDGGSGEAGGTGRL